MPDDMSYPRPFLRRASWQRLDGFWDFGRDADAIWTQPKQVDWTESIVVPFAPESPASGIGENGFLRACWYRRTVEVNPPDVDDRVILHFGAVDDQASVWVNDQLVGTHVGGYTPFSFDITDQLDRSGQQIIVVRAEDDPHDLAKPRGKQDWLLEPHGIWYPRTTGIWQTVWLERVSSTRLDWLRWQPNVERWELALDARISGFTRDDLMLQVRLTVGDVVLADDRYSVVSGEVHRRIALIDPGIDDARNHLMWRPGAPTLIDAELTLLTKTGEVIDEVKSYTAMRSVGIDGDRFMLNGRPLQLRLVLDQGYWPESGLTAPDDSAMRRDIELAMAMGFNGARKHQKIEDPRYLAWADRLGFLVWEELPSAYRFDPRSVNRLTREWLTVLDRDASHPSIIAWVPFNESWGVPDLPLEATQRDFVRALYHLTKAIDPTRPVSGNDGWEQLTTDLFAIHDYESDPAKLTSRYGAPDQIEALVAGPRPGNRRLAIEEHPYAGQPVLLSEFGGIAFTSSEDRDSTWGYVRSESADAFAAAYTNLLETVRSLPMFAAGFCYTQFTDTYQEANGLLTADRQPKFPIEQIAMATRGPKSPREIERDRRETLRKREQEPPSV